MNIELIHINMLCVVICSFGIFKAKDFIGTFLNATGFFLNLSLVLREYL